MNLNDVILTPKETEKLANNHLEKHGCLDTFTRERDKAQCLKLLDVLNSKELLIHFGIHGKTTDESYGCPTCEIEKLLKGAK